MSSSAAATSHHNQWSTGRGFHQEKLLLSIEPDWQAANLRSFEMCAGTMMCFSLGTICERGPGQHGCYLLIDCSDSQTASLRGFQIAHKAAITGDTCSKSLPREEKPGSAHTVRKGAGSGAKRRKEAFIFKSGLILLCHTKVDKVGHLRKTERRNSCQISDDFTTGIILYRQGYH